MKSLIVVSMGMTLSTVAGVAAVPVMRDAATHQQLAAMYREAVQQDPMRKQAPAKGPDPSTATPAPDLIADSDIICFNGNVTLVPKRAILQMPKNIVDRFKYQPGAKLMSWGEFYALNRGWITTVEVSRSQAAGKDALADETKKQMVKSGNLIVATYLAGPISVLPPKAPVEPASTPSTTPISTTPKP